MTDLDETGPRSSGFLYVTCQVGAEAALKNEMRRRWPAFRFAFSRPGFLTFKLPPQATLDDAFALECVFARTWGYCLGNTSATALEARAANVWQLAGDLPSQALHVWQRDIARPGWHGFEPHVTPAAMQAEAAVREQWPPGEGVEAAPHVRVAQPGMRVLDCILVEPDQWWIAWHVASDVPSRYPGGVISVPRSEHSISRAYLKMQEMLAWAQLPIERGQRVVELGCAPGGASQALLDHGLAVIGVDPAQVDGQLLADPNFTHVQKRAADVRRREFRGIPWLAADMNVAPDTTLETVEAIVTHEAVNVRGLLLTLKLLDWKMADAVPEYLDRIRRWGYTNVQARQLAHHRQEIGVVALRSTRKKRRASRPTKREPSVRKARGR